MKNILSTPMLFSSPTDNNRKTKSENYDISTLFSQYNPCSPTHKAYINHKVPVQETSEIGMTETFLSPIPVKERFESDKSFLNESSIEDINLQIEKTRKHVERLNEQLSLSCPPFKAEKDEFLAKYCSKLMGPSSKMNNEVDRSEDLCFTPAESTTQRDDGFGHRQEKRNANQGLPNSKVEYGEVSFSHIGKYIGQYANAQLNQQGLIPHGKGTFYYSTGTTYSGHFVNGKKQGKGQMEYKDGSIYKGDFFDNFRHGNGVYRCRAYSYSGSWEFDKKKGQGIIVYSNGESYEGTFDNNLPHGSGKYLFKDKSVYEGEFSNGYPHGNGTLIYSDHVTMYDGEWKQGKKSGKARLVILPNGYYEGDMENDCKHGKGRYVYKNGDVYEGGFKQDKKHGQGIYFFAQGGYLKGTWHLSAKQGHALLCAPDGTLYEEVWDNDVLISKKLVYK